MSGLPGRSARLSRYPGAIRAQKRPHREFRARVARLDRPHHGGAVVGHARSARRRLGRARLRERQQQVFAQESDHRRRDAVADEMQRVGRARRQPVAVRKAHQARRLARRHEPRADRVRRKPRSGTGGSSRRPACAGSRRGRRSAPRPGPARRRRRRAGCGGRGRRRDARRSPAPARRRVAMLETARSTSALVCAASRQRCGSGSRQSTSRTLARGPSGSRHQIQSAASAGGRAAATRLSADET